MADDKKEGKVIRDFRVKDKWRDILPTEGSRGRNMRPVEQSASGNNIIQISDYLKDKQSSSQNIANEDESEFVRGLEEELRKTEDNISQYEQAMHPKEEDDVKKKTIVVNKEDHVLSREVDLKGNPFDDRGLTTKKVITVERLAELGAPQYDDFKLLVIKYAEPVVQNKTNGLPRKKWEGGMAGIYQDDYKSFGNHYLDQGFFEKQRLTEIIDRVFGKYLPQLADAKEM